MKLKISKSYGIVLMEMAPEETFGLDDKRIKCVERLTGQGCERCVFVRIVVHNFYARNKIGKIGEM